MHDALMSLGGPQRPPLIVEADGSAHLEPGSGKGFYLPKGFS